MEIFSALDMLANRSYECLIDSSMIDAIGYRLSSFFFGLPIEVGYSDFSEVVEQQLLIDVAVLLSSLNFRPLSITCNILQRVLSEFAFLKFMDYINSANY
jgi:hypothetical protein